MKKLVASLGGPQNILSEHKKILPKAKYNEEIFSDHIGYVKSILTRELGIHLIELGGGRKSITDKIDYSVGFSNVIGVGTQVDKKTPLLKIHAKNKEDINKIKNNIKNCFVISSQVEKQLPNIYDKII